MAKRAPQPWVRNKDHAAYKRLVRIDELPEKSEDWSCLRFDGACNGNGQLNATGGYGWSVQGPLGCFVWSSCGSVDSKPVTNNVAEWSGLLDGLSWIASQPDIQRQVSMGLRIEGDSNLVVKGLTGGWKCQDRRMAYFRDLCLDQIAKIGCYWGAVWIPREQNTVCDLLSRRFLY